MKFLTGRPVLALIFFVAIVVLGVYSLVNTPIELLPDASLPSLSITAGWRGASAEMVMQRVALPIEEEVMGVKWVNKLSTTCNEGTCRISVEFARDADMNFVYVLLKERLNKLRDKLPPQVRPPSIQPYMPREFQQRAFIVMSLFGDEMVSVVRNRVDREVVPALRSIPGIKGLEVTGGVPMVVKIIPDVQKMRSLGASIEYLQSVLDRSFFTSPAVVSRLEGKEISLAFSQSPADIQAIADMPLGKLGERVVHLKDIAQVFMGYQEIENEGRFNGQPTVNIAVVKQANASSMLLSKRIRAVMEGLSRKHGEKLHYRVVFDQSEELSTRLGDLIQISLLILLIIFVILLVTVRDLRASLLIFASVFFSVCAAFTAIYLLKIPLNILTLSGFALGFGMFVDNAVVVFDNILRQREKGVSPREASIEGPRQVIVPVLASTLTTVIVFFSFAYFQGRLRIFYLPLAQVITLALLSSVVVSFTLIPPLAARMKLRFRPLPPDRRHPVFRFYIRYPLFVLLPIAALAFFSTRYFLKEGTFGRFISYTQKQTLNVWLVMPSGSEFQDTRDTILQFEKIALDKPYAKEITLNIRNKEEADMTISFPPEIEFSAAPYLLKQELIALAAGKAGMGISVSGFDPESYNYSQSGGSFLPYGIEIRGYDFQRLTQIAEELKKSLLLHRRIKEVSIQSESRFYFGGGGKTFYFHLKSAALNHLRMPPNYLLQLIGATISTGQLRQEKIRMGDKEYDLEIRLKDTEGLELGELLAKELFSPEGVPFRLSEVVEVEEKEVKGGIQRENQEYMVKVNWDFMGSSKAGERYYKAVFKNLELPAGFRKIEPRFDWEMKEEEKQQLNIALVLSLFLVFLIIAILYQSLLQTLLILTAVPLGLIGVFLAFPLAGFPFDSTAYVGVILLFGVVVNNAIILVDHINYYVRKGFTVRDAICQGAYERIRPVFITTATAVLGALPMVLVKQSEQTDIWSSLALCTVGGLTSSTLLLLIVVPICYDLLWRLRLHWANRSFRPAPPVQEAEESGE